MSLLADLSSIKLVAIIIPERAAGDGAAAESFSEARDELPPGILEAAAEGDGAAAGRAGGGGKLPSQATGRIARTVAKQRDLQHIAWCAAVDGTLGGGEAPAAPAEAAAAEEEAAPDAEVVP